MNHAIHNLILTVIKGKNKPYIKRNDLPMFLQPFSVYTI